MAKLRVHRRAYRRRAHNRRAYTKRFHGKLIHIPATHVKATRVGSSTYSIQDRGAPGRGKRLIKLRKGSMTHWAEKGHFIKKGGRISDIPDSRMDNFALYLARKVGAARAQKMFRAQIILRKRSRNGFKDKMQIAHDTITKKYEKELAPIAAIQAWHRMSPRERARRMPGGRI